MKNYTVRRFESRDTALWNAFIGQAKNATFLFHRDFMDYHADRFQDFSLLVFEEEQLIASLPAHIENGTVFSHWGLTYGGFVFNEKVKLLQAIKVLQSALRFLQDNAVDTLCIKLVPTMYHAYFSEEIEYALFLVNAELIRRDCLSVIDLKKPFSVTKTRRESIRRGEKNGLVIKEEPEFDLFWEEILIPNLDKKHQAKPVHTAAEMTKLHQYFPDRIRHFNVYNQNKIVAGTTVFVTDKVAHPQYVSGNPQKNELGSLDFLYNYLITSVFKHMDYFDFGISHEDNGRKINEGLLFWKESFGAKTTVQDFYQVKTSHYSLLEDILV